MEMKLYAQRKNFDDLASILNKYLGIGKSALKTLKADLTVMALVVLSSQFGNKGKIFRRANKTSRMR